MPSPFPGMDPYLEPHWPDVHTALVGEARRQLNRSLSAGLIARAEERVAVNSEDHLDRRIRKGGIVIEAPYKIVVDYDPIVERFIRILDEGGELITVIEFLSPANKVHPGIEAFRTKRRELLAAGVHVVEVDLIRAGDWRAVMRPERCPPEGVSTYRAVVRTTGPLPGGYLFPITLPKPLPDVPIPLRPKDKPVPLPLQSLLSTVYDDGRYDQTIDYGETLDPPLSSEDAGWLDQLLKSAGKR